MSDANTDETTFAAAARAAVRLDVKCRNLESQNQALQEALDLIATIQPGVLSMLRREGFKFETPLTESEGWEKLAFTLYLTICEVDSIARNALSPTQETDPE